MKIKKSFRIKLDFLTIFIMIGTLFVVGYIRYQHVVSKNITAMEYHCNEINRDVTRPYLRYCIKPISLKNGFFIFKTKNGGSEEYLIISDNKDSEDIVNNVFHYTFVK